MLGGMYVFAENLYGATASAPQLRLLVEPDWKNTVAAAADAANPVVYAVTSYGMLPSTGAVYKITHEGTSLFCEGSDWGTVCSAG